MVTQHDQPDPPPEPARIECAGECGTMIVADDAHAVPWTKGGDASLCPSCALDWAHAQHVRLTTETDYRTLHAMGEIFLAVGGACTRQAERDSTPSKPREPAKDKTSNSRPPPRRLTVIIRDASPLRHMQEPVRLRSVTIGLTGAQSAALTLRYTDHDCGADFWEEISHAFFEPETSNG